jgi:hypothetical protein
LREPHLERLLLLAVFGLPLPPAMAQPATDTASQCLTALFGPETFPLPGRPRLISNAHDAPAPRSIAQAVRRTISLRGFAPPFVLRVTNGEGDHAVRQGWVWLDGRRVLGPSDFARQILVHERAVDLKEGSTLQVRVPSADGRQLRVEILGRPPDYEPLVLTPEGGHYELKSGAMLDVPPGAVDEETPIAVCGVSTASAQSRLDANAPQLGYMAAGFQGVPSGLAFNVPVTITLPTSARRSPSDVPLTFVMGPRGTGFSLAETNLRHDPETGLLQARVSHFSERVYAFARDAIKAKYDCREKVNWCRCTGDIEVIERSSETTVVDECYEITYDLLVTYIACSGEQEGLDIRAKDIPEVRIDPSSPRVTMCEPGLQLGAVGIHETEPKERPLRNQVWETSDPAVASVSSSGFVQPHADGCTAVWSTDAPSATCWANIYARGSCGAENFVQFEVTGPKTIEGLEAPPELLEGATHTLTARAVDAHGGPLPCETIVWSSSDERVVTVKEGVLTAGKAGEAVVTAKAQHNSTAKAEVTVKVRGKDACDNAACSVVVAVAVQPPVLRCSPQANACVYTGDGSLQLKAWLKNDATGEKSERELAWAGVPVTGSVVLAPASDPDPRVTRVQVKGFVPGMVTMQAIDPASGSSATLKVHVVPWLFQASATGSYVGGEYWGPPTWKDPSACSDSGPFEAGMSVRLPGPWPAPAFDWVPFSGWVTRSGPTCPYPGVIGYAPDYVIYWFNVSGPTVTYHWQCPDTSICTSTLDVNATFDDTGMTGTLVYDHHCASPQYPGWSWWWTETTPFTLGAVAVSR